MAVSDGQRVNASVTNAAFVSRTQDSDTVGVVGLKNPSSGGDITNAQQAINDNAAAIASNDGDIAALQVSKEDKINKDVPNGYAGLDGNGRIAKSALPLDTIVYQGTYDASLNSPALADGVGESGDFYRVSVAGTQDLGSGPITFNVGDWVTYNGSIWQRSDFATAGVIDDLDDVDTTTTAPNVGDVLEWDGSNWVPAVPSGGSGQGGINYITNPDAEVDASGWVQYADAAGVAPVDGTGGSPNGIFGTQSGAAFIIRGGASFELVHNSGTDRQGQGVSTDFTIDKADLEKTLQVSFEYAVSDTSAFGDFQAFIYDIDNATLLGAVENDDEGKLIPGGYSTLSVDYTKTMLGFFQATDSLNYRLIIHRTDAKTADDYRLYFDNVKAGPSESFVPVIYQNSAVLDLSTDAAFTGGEVTVSRVGNVVTLITTADPTFSSSVNPFTAVGFLPDWARPGAGVAVFNVHKFASTVVQEVYTDTSGVFGLVFRDWAGALVAQTSADDITLSYVVEDVPSSNVVSNARLTQETPSVSAAGNAGTALTANVTNIDFTEVSDSHNSWDGTTFTAPKSGIYEATGMITFSAGVTPNINAFVDGVQEKKAHHAGYSSSRHPFNWQGFLEKGQTLSFRSSVSATLSSSTEDHWIEINSNPDFTNYGVINPSSTALEVSSTTNYAATTSVDTWDVPTTVFKLTLDEGTWDIDAVFVSSLVTTAGVVIPQYALSESTTPGVGLIDIAFGSVAQDGTTHSRRAFGVMNLKEYTVASQTDLYIHVRGLAVAGGSAISSFSIGTFNGTNTRLTARRIK